MRLQSTNDDVTDMTSQLMSGGSRLSDVGDPVRWITDQSDRDVSVLTIINATHRDAGLIVCYDVTSSRRSVSRVFQLVVTDDYLPNKGRLACVFHSFKTISEEMVSRGRFTEYLKIFPKIIVRSIASLS